MHAAEKAGQHELLLLQSQNALTKQQKFDHLRPWHIVQINLNVLVILFASVEIVFVRIQNCLFEI